MTRKQIIQIVAGIVVIVFVVETWLKNRQFDLGWLKYYSTAVFLAGLALAAWDSILWRIDIVQRIPGVPRCIRGTWRGTLTSFWIDPSTGIRPTPKTIYLVVRQNFSVVSVKLFTDQSQSSSTMAEIHDLDGSLTLVYLYLNRPEIAVESHSRMHHGSAALDISGSPASRMRGRYWTDRDTKGELEFRDKHPRLADDYANAAGLF